jgi:hypothetical protein
MKRQIKELRRLRKVCLGQARAASTELEKNAFLEVAEQYQQAESMGEFRARAGGISVYVSSLFWLAFLLATAVLVALYVPW